MADSSPLAHSPTLVSKPGAGGERPNERLEHGAKVGEYLVEGFLGAGAMGEVYAGIQPVIGKKVAIKVLKREVGSSPDGAARFTREARAVNQIDHPNVIDIFSLDRLDDGRLYLVMDLVEGRSLRKALADGPLDVETALEVLSQIADALDAAHSKGVIHRDLKPDNVMLGSGSPVPKVFVLDFGLAKLVTPADAVAPASMLTGQGTWLGTPGYMAPEQWSADGAGPASDRYSLGVMAFELLSGSLPFQAASLPQMMEQHFRAKVPALSTRGAIQARSTFDPVVSRAMAKDPDARFPSAREMVEALRKAAGKPGRKAGAASGSRSWIPAAAGGAALVFTIAGVLLVRGNRGDADSEADDRRPSAAPATGKVRVEIYSHPQKAEALLDDDSLIGMTPTHRDLEPGTTFSFRVRKPGYATVRHSLRVPDEDVLIPAFTLEPVNGFEGVWALPSGELRSFRRTDDDRVAVSKLLTVTGEPEFFRHYTFAPADRGAVFRTSEIVIDPDAPNEPTCHIPQELVYTFDPGAQTLVLRREEVIHDLVAGKCVKKSASFAPPEPLTRVDVRSATDRATLPPAGTLEKPSALDEAEIKKKLDAQSNAKKPPSKKPSKLPPPQKPVFQEQAKTAVQNAPGDMQGDSAQQNNPPPQAPQPQQNAVAPPVQKAPPKQQANPPRQNVSGDSQIAPQLPPQVQQKQRKK